MKSRHVIRNASHHETVRALQSLNEAIGIREVQSLKIASFCTRVTRELISEVNQRNTNMIV
jgi:hypothetical protein